MKTTRPVFDQQMDKLDTSVRLLASQVEQQLVGAMETLQQDTLSTAQKVIDAEKEINRCRYELEEQAYTLLALQQPMARDLRRIVTAANLTTHLERMGDHAVGIARLRLRMEYLPLADDIAPLHGMSTLALAYFGDAMRAFDTFNGELARAVLQRDNGLEVYRQVLYHHFMNRMKTSPEMISTVTMLLWVAHNIERYAAHARNICHRIVYVATGDLYARP